ncbi:MAG: anti-sigma factor [Terriglobia bacterium]
MNEHSQFEELFDEYALGALEGEEKQAFEAHLKGCPECARKVQEARARIALLALSAPQTTPSGAVRDRLLGQLRSQISQPESGPPRRRHFWGWGVPIFAAAAIILAVATGILVTQNHGLQRRLSYLAANQAGILKTERRQQAAMARALAVLDILTSPDSVKVSLIAAKVHPAPQGTAFYNLQKGLVFYAANLPTLGPGRTYQLWLVPSQGAPVSAGVFNVDSKGDGEVLLPPLPPQVPAKAFAVTVEPAGGEPQPTGEKVLVGAVS